MAYVNTVLGTIHPDEMGITSIHEHIMWGPPGWEYNPGVWFDISKVFEKSYTELVDYRLLGGRTFVDCSGIGLGRDLDLYVKLASSSGINLVACTGFWSDDGIAPHFRTKDIDFFEELFVRELTQGMGHTLIKAGVIKVGNGLDEFTKLEDIEYRAAARAAKRTGSAIITHGINFALHQLDLFKEEGLNLSKIVVSHADEHLDMERDKEVARRGAYIAYDHVGVEKWCRMFYARPDEERLEYVLAMLNAGFEDRVMIATDTNSKGLGWGETYLHNPAHLLRYFVPKMKKAGIKDKTITKLLVENTRRVLPMG